MLREQYALFSVSEDKVPIEQGIDRDIKSVSRYSILSPIPQNRDNDSNARRARGRKLLRWPRGSFEVSYLCRRTRGMRIV